MMIGMAGTGGTGKTTVAELLKSFLTVPFVPSVVRGVMAEFNSTDYSQRNMSGIDRWRMQSTMFARKEELDAKTTEGLFDRTIVDHFAYCICQCAERMTDKTVLDMRERVRINLLKYDQIFFFPIYDWEVADDGFRDLGLAYRLTINDIIYAELVHSRVPFLTMANVDPSTRVESILSSLSVKYN